jgi:dienelactone hydrolase
LKGSFLLADTAKMWPSLRAEAALSARVSTGREGLANGSAYEVMDMQTGALVGFKKRGVSLFSLAAGMLLASACGSAPDDLSVEDVVEADEASPSVLAQEAGDESSCLADIKDYGPRGPFRYTSKRAGAINMLIPQVPAGCKVPVAHLANGTGATCGIYQSILNTLASHGFITTCYESTNTGAGTQGLQALERAVADYPNLAAKKFASLGHSQGGQASFVVLQYAEDKFGPDAKYAGLAMQPASGFGSQPRERWQTVYSKIKSPMFMFSGTADILVSQSWVRQAFTALNDSIEAYHWSARGSTHIPTPNAETAEIAVPWFRWKLLGDQAACQRFKQMASGGRWSQVQAQNAAPCE